MYLSQSTLLFLSRPLIETEERTKREVERERHLKLTLLHLSLFDPVATWI